MEQVKPNKFCHQIPKLFQEKAEVNDFAKRCITGMREFIDSIVHPADTKFDAEYLAQTRDHKNEHGDIKRQMISSLGIYEPLCSLGGGTPSW
jgi:hypothetical protein